MKIKTIIAFALVGLAVFLGLFLHSKEQSYDVYPNENTQISLYGESHGYGPYYEMELNLWKEYYDQGCRNLFVELPYYTAEFLNEWMKADSDEIIDIIWVDIQGTQSCNDYAYKFYHDIKEQCPETVFYGTDVGHQHFSTGLRFKTYLEERGLEDTERYALTLENIIQGEEYYAEYAPSGISPIRENYMVENFIAAYDRCGGGKIMGIYGSYHTNLYASDRMGGMLKDRYGDKVSGVALSSLAFEKVKHEPYEFGFCLTGLVFLIMLFVPNIIWERGKQPKGYEEEAKNESKILLIFERVGEALTSAVLLVFPSLNPKMKLLPGGLFMEWDVIIWIMAFVLMIFYECYWIKYFRSERTLKDMYASFAGFPVAGASLPVIAVLLLGIYSGNLIVIAAAVILGIGHIGIHVNHARNL
jgi:hypothetical protein